MRKLKSKCGYTVYHATAFEVMRLGGIGVCDECNTASIDGYLVPVLNHYMCPSCYKEWNERAVFYPEDVPHEERVAEYYEATIPTDETEVCV